MARSPHSSRGSQSGASALASPAARSRKTPGERFATDALLLRRVDYGEADLVVTFFTETRGAVSAIARAARKSVKRFGALEPLHLLRITLEERPGADLCHLVEARLRRPRIHLLDDLSRIESASMALQWVRRASPQRVPEPALWRDVNGLLDELAESPNSASGRAQLAAMGMRLLQGTGWGLQLVSCVRCGRACNENATACIDAAQGGLVCRACGGARTVLRPSLRRALMAALTGEAVELSADDAACAIELVTDSLKAHAAG